MSSTLKRKLRRAKKEKYHTERLNRQNNAKFTQVAIAMRNVIQAYADPRNWRDGDNTTDVIRNGVVIGVNTIKEWVGPGNGPEIARQMLLKVPIVSSQAVREPDDSQKQEEVSDGNRSRGGGSDLSSSSGGSGETDNSEETPQLPGLRSDSVRDERGQREL